MGVGTQTPTGGEDMAARILSHCPAEIHFPELGLGRTCTRETGHEGAHYGTKPIPTGYTPVVWEGDDRPDATT